jgi:rhodanese-related sulfurtransferase
LTLRRSHDDNSVMAVPRITKEELKQQLDTAGPSAPVLIDVRLKYPYEHSTVTLPGAIRMAPSALDKSRLTKDRALVLYDSDPEELVSSKVAEELIREGYRVTVLAGGLGEWVTAKLPTDSKPAPQPAAPAAGSLKG